MMESKWVTVSNRRMHARVFLRQAGGDSPAVVLVHGLGVSSRYMIPTAVRLAPHARVYAPDLPGFGRSARPPRPLDVGELADALAAWMHASGLDRAAFIANSFGCQVVVDLAVQHPDRVNRILLTAPTIDPKRRTAVEQIARFLLNIPREPFSLVPIALGDYLRAGIWRGLRTLRYALNDPIEEKLSRVRAQTLVVRGARDPIVPQDWAEEVTRLLPAAALHVLPSAAHAVNYNSPDALARLGTLLLAHCGGDLPDAREVAGTGERKPIEG